MLAARPGGASAWSATEAGGALFLLGYRLRANWANMERYFWRALDKVEEERKRDQNKHLLQFLGRSVGFCFLDAFACAALC